MIPPPNHDQPDAILLYRLDAVEKGYHSLIDELKAQAKRQEERHESLALKLDAAMVHMRSHACPTPGACTSLLRDTSELGKGLDRIEKIIEKHESQLNELRTTAAEGRAGLRATIFWVGIMSAGIGGMLSLVGPAVLGKLH